MEEGIGEDREKYLQGTGWTTRARARRTNTAKRAPNLLMHHRFVLVHVDTISIDQPGHTNTY